VPENLEHSEKNQEQILRELAENKKGSPREPGRKPRGNHKHSHGHGVEHAHSDGSSSLTTVGSTNGHNYEILVVQHSHEHDVGNR